MSPRAVVFCGVGEESGRDWICAQSAELLAHFRPSSICVVDANVNNPTLHTYFGLSNARGLSAALAESGPVTNFTQQIGKGRLRLLNAGDRSAELGAGASGSAARLAARVRELRSLFDYVLVNAPPAMHETVTGYLGSLSDGIVLIVEPGFTPREATRASKEEIEASGGRVLGVVLHRRALSLSDRNNSQLPAASDGPAR
jgi:Mrp family chromosome partitioning ATPase